MQPVVRSLLTVSFAFALSSTCIAQVQDERTSLGLESGKYTATLIYRFSDKDKDVRDEIDLDLTLEGDGKVMLTDPKQPHLPAIKGTLEQRAFTATMDDAEGIVRFKGRLSSENKLTGVLSGTHRNGSQTANGTFTISKKLVWERFNNKVGRLSLDFPGQPVAKEKKIDDSMKELSFIRPVGRETVFSLAYLDLSPTTVSKYTPQELIVLYRKGSRKSKELTDDREIEFKNAQAREYRLEAEPGFFVRERLILKGNRLYTIYVGAEEKAFLDSKDSAKFFDSLKLED